MASNTMLAVVTTGDGNFELRKVPIPVPKADEILVKVEACAQNHTDWKTIILHKQAGNIVGSDFAGTVVAIGEEVPEGLRNVGERIAGTIAGNIHPNGSFSEYLITHPSLVFALPDDVPFEVAAQMGIAMYGACQALYQTLHLPTPLDPAKEPMDILVWSGTSSTGQFAVQLAKLSGMRVISTASPGNFDLVLALGAAEVFDYADSRTPKKIVATTSGSLKYAVDCISSGMTPAQVSNSLGKDGGTVATLLPYESRKKGVKTKLIVVYSLWGKDVEIPIKVKGDPEHFHNGVFYSTMISQLLSEKKIKFGAVNVFPNGLASVEDGFNYMKTGKIHAEKIVYRISDTPDINT